MNEEPIREVYERFKHMKPVFDRADDKESFEKFAMLEFWRAICAAVDSAESGGK